MIKLMNSINISGMMQIPLSHEPLIEQIENSSKNGIFIGSSYHYNMPVFVSFEELLNPHILICGMTGSGKTFLANSFIVRMHLFSEASMVVIDFTGEYKESISNLTKSNTLEIKELLDVHAGIMYVDLHEMTEANKVKEASELLDCLADIMRKRGQKQTHNVFVLLDEAWKLIGANHGLEIIIREGRKYGVGLITSSQMLHDTNSNILSNMATIFIFKTTNRKSLDKISKNYNVSETELLSIQNLDLGSCFLIQLRKSGLRSAFVIKKVVGIRNANIIKLNNGGNVEISVDVADFESITASLCGLEKSRSVKGIIKDNVVYLPDFVGKLIECGVDRRKVLSALHKIGFDYIDIADSFSIALSKIGDNYEE
ncbi:MAG: helicase HerA domain-containing protein [Candidatus Micrarchaeaceae archaeon]